MTAEALHINITFACNCNCIFCVTASSMRKPDKPFREIRAQLEAASNAGIRRVIFCGGEPTIRRDLPLLLSKAARMGFNHIEVKTNGCRLSERAYLRTLVEAGATAFSVSIHGPLPKVHDSLTRHRGSFQKSVQALKNIKDIGYKVCTATCITKPNYRLLTETIRLFIDLNSDQVIIQFVEPTGGARRHFNEVVPSYSEINTYVREAASVLKQANIPFLLHGFPFCMIQGDERFSSDLYRIPTQIQENERVVKDYFALYEAKVLRAKGTQCTVCTYYPMCAGPWKEYLRRYGEAEFEPITDLSPVDTIPVPILGRSLFKLHLR